MPLDEYLVKIDTGNTITERITKENFLDVSGSTYSGNTFAFVGGSRLPIIIDSNYAAVIASEKGSITNCDWAAIMGAQLAGNGQFPSMTGSDGSFMFGVFRASTMTNSLRSMIGANQDGSMSNCINGVILGTSSGQMSDQQGSAIIGGSEHIIQGAGFDYNTIIAGNSNEINKNSRSAILSSYDSTLTAVQSGPVEGNAIITSKDVLIQASDYSNYNTIIGSSASNLYLDSVGNGSGNTHNLMVSSDDSQLLAEENDKHNSFIGTLSCEIQTNEGTNSFGNTILGSSTSKIETQPTQSGISGTTIQSSISSNISGNTSYSTIRASRNSFIGHSTTTVSYHNLIDHSNASYINKSSSSAGNQNAIILSDNSFIQTTSGDNNLILNSTSAQLTGTTDHRTNSIMTSPGAWMFLTTGDRNHIFGGNNHTMSGTSMTDNFLIGGTTQELSGGTGSLVIGGTNSDFTGATHSIALGLSGRTLAMENRTTYTERLTALRNWATATYDNGSGSTFTVNWDNGGFQKITLTGDTDITFTNMRDGANLRLIVTNGGTHSITGVTASGYTILCEGSSIPNITNNGTDMCILEIFGTDIFIRHFSDFGTP